MKMKPMKPMKPLIAAGAAGALLAAGGLAAVNLGTSDATAATNGVPTNKQLETMINANQKRVVADLKRVCTVWNGGGYVTSDPGSKPPPASAPKCTSKTAVGTGWPSMDINKESYFYWYKVYYDGAKLNYSCYGDCTVTRIAAGMYQVKWPFPIENCVYTSAIAYYAGGDPTKYYYTNVMNDPDPNAAKVYTYKMGGPAAWADPVSWDAPVQGTMNCHAPDKVV